MIDELREELSLFNLLRQVFLKELSKEFIEAISKVDLLPESDDEISYGLKLMIESARRNSQRLSEWTEELAVEYARLFIGPENPPAIPYASFYLSESRSLMTDETLDVRKRYLDAGVAVKDLYSIPDDHIGIELEFIYDLTRRIIEKFEKEPREDVSRLFEIRDDFISGHMAVWVPLFVEKIIKAAGDDFYKGASCLLKGSILTRDDGHI